MIIKLQRDWHVIAFCTFCSYELYICISDMLYIISNSMHYAFQIKTACRIKIIIRHFKMLQNFIKVKYTLKINQFNITTVIIVVKINLFNNYNITIYYYCYALTKHYRSYA